jgi:hypothetical protein
VLRIGHHHLKQWLILFVVVTPCFSSNCVSANHLPLCRRTLPPPITLQTEAFTLEQALAQRETSFLVYKASVDIVENGWMYDPTIGREDRIAMERTEGTYSTST